MTTITGIPAHALLVHAIVVLAPLTALLEMLCAFWPAARRRLVWLVLALAAVTLVLTPLTTEAGEWLYNQQAQPSDILRTHAERGAVDDLLLGRPIRGRDRASRAALAHKQVGQAENRRHRDRRGPRVGGRCVVDRGSGADRRCRCGGGLGPTRLIDCNARAGS